MTLSVWRRGSLGQCLDRPSVGESYEMPPELARALAAAPSAMPSWSQLIERHQSSPDRVAEDYQIMNLKRLYYGARRLDDLLIGGPVTSDRDGPGTGYR